MSRRRKVSSVPRGRRPGLFGVQVTAKSAGSIEGKSMRRVVVLTVVVAVSLFALPLVGTAGPATTSITGGGIAQNDNSGGGDLLGIGGFNAKDRGGVASGQVQFKTVDDEGNLISQLHGNVSCVAETTAVAGSQGWEIRFVVTHSAGPVAVPIGAYGSLFVQDNSDGDMVDESFGAPFTA